MDLADLLIKLVSFRTTTYNPDEIENCADYIEGYLKHPNIIVKRYKKRDKISIVATFEDTKKPRIFLNAHFDVVPAPNHLFFAHRDKNRIYGRGSADCKAQVAVLMRLMKDLADEKNRPNIGIMLTSDEELGGEDGVFYLLNELGFGCDFAVVADGGEDFNIVTKHKGILDVQVRTTGKAAHSSMYWEGENAADKLLQLYPKLARLYPSLTKSEWKTSVCLTKVQSGETLNQVPDQAMLNLNIRFTHPDEEDEIIKKIKAVGDVDVTVVTRGAMLFTDDQHPLVQKLKSVAEKHAGSAAITYENGGTDARFFSAKEIPAVLISALGSGYHADSESVETNSLQTLYDILKEFVR